MNAVQREIKKWLSEFEIKFEIDNTKGGHTRVILICGDKTACVIASASPSDHRFKRNFLAQVRRSYFKISGVKI